MAATNQKSESVFPEFDSVEGMRDGYASGDKANPTLRSFVDEVGTPFDGERDEYSAVAFASPITTTKATKAYNIHTYPSKKPHDAIRSYIDHYTDAGDIVLDPFCGSGGTALAALTLDRAAVCIDRSPAATFIAQHYCTPVSRTELMEAFRTLEAKVSKEISWLYGTRCDRCDGYASVGYTVYSQVFQCPRCLTSVPLYDCIEASGVTAAGKSKQIAACPSCFAKGHTEEITTKLPKLGAIPVVTSYICESGCTPKRAKRAHNDADSKKRKYFEDYDLALISEIDSKDIPHWTPSQKMMNVEDDALPWGVKWRAGTSNFRHVSDLYTKRNLWALAAIRSAADGNGHLLFAMTGICLNTSTMVRESNTQFMQGTYYIPQVSKEVNVWSSYSGRVKQLIEYQSVIADIGGGHLLVSTQSATDLGDIASESVDYIFTDPPYSDTVQYGELNFVWEAWLNLDTTWHADEIIVNKVRGETEAEWTRKMHEALSECYRVLKPGRWITLCYHDTSEGTWALIQDLMIEVGFVIDTTDSAVFIDTGQKSYNQYTADKATKRDLVLNFRKPKPGDWAVSHLFIPADVDTQTFKEMAQQVVVEYLTSHPGATRDRVYDELVSRMVRRGEMEAHDFDALLSGVADEVHEGDSSASKEVSRWYVKETADLIDRAEQQKEDAAANKLELYMGTILAKYPEREGVHYSDLFEQVVTIGVDDRPRRLFENWLPEYFFKTSSGTWRPPADEAERQQKAAIREAGTLRRMKRFANALIEGVPVREQDRPDGVLTLVEWIRQCRRAGLYEQGRALYEKGGLDLTKLDDEEQIEVEDDYRICVKRGSEDKPKKKSKARKKKS